MKGFIGFTRRNLLLYFKDVGAVIFSLLTSIIVFALYLLFLRDNYVDITLSGLREMNLPYHQKDVDSLINGLLLSGIIGSALITVPFSCLSNVVRDRESRKDFDILSTPLSRAQIALSYYLSATISAILVTSVILSIGLGVMAASGGLHMSIQNVVSAYGGIVLGSVSSTALFMILVVRFNSSASCDSFFGILSAAGGFVIGAYIPISQFSSAVQTVCNLFPATHITVLERNALMDGALKRIDAGLNGVDGGEFRKTIEGIFSFKAKLFGEQISVSIGMLYVALATAVFLVVMTVLFAKTYKKK